MAQWFRLPLLSSEGRALSLCEASRCFALPKVPERRWTDGGNGNGEQPHASECLVLGCLSDRQSDTGHLRRAVSETIGDLSLRDRIRALASAPRWHGTSKSGSHWRQRR